MTADPTSTNITASSVIPSHNRNLAIAAGIPTADPTGDIASASTTGIITTIVDSPCTVPRMARMDPPDTIVLPSATTNNDPTSSIIASSGSSWDTSMGLPYILKLNSFALKRRNDIISQIKRVSPTMNLSDTVSYACRAIDAEETRRSTSDDASIVSTVPSPPPPTVSVSFSQRVETVPETDEDDDDDDDDAPGLQDRALAEDTSDDDDDDTESAPAPSLSSTTVSDTVLLRRRPRRISFRVPRRVLFRSAPCAPFLAISSSSYSSQQHNLLDTRHKSKNDHLRTYIVFAYCFREIPSDSLMVL